MSNFYGGRIIGMQRLRNSAAGNPRWHLTLDNGVEFATEPDAQVAYALSETEHLNKWVTLRLSSTRNVVGVEVIGAHTGPLPELGPLNGITEAESEAFLAAVSPDAPAPTPEEAAYEALLEAADAFPSDIPGQSLVKEWLTERAEKYRTGELVIP